MGFVNEWAHIASKMANPKCFAAILLFSLATSAVSIESFAQAQDYKLQQKQGFDRSLELAGFTAEKFDKFISMDDDYLDKDSEFSFLLDDNQDYEQDAAKESSIETRACSHQCDKTCYYPLTHQCCNGLLLNGFWTCSKCVPPSGKRCAGRCYPNGFKCCYDKVIPDAWPCCPYHCNGKCFDAQKDKCCYNRIIPRSTVCCELGKYCGNNCYNSTVSSCCNGQAIDKGTQCCASKCGKTCYDKAKMKCCQKKLISISSPCCTPPKTRCGNTCYDPRNRKCCRNRVILKNLPCCTPPKTRCGNTCYNPRNRKCCRNRVVLKNLPCCTPPKTRCGNTCYNPRNRKCCRNRVVLKNRPCGCTRCGGVCINTRSHKCCHHRVTLKNIPCISGSGHPVRITSGLIARKVGCFRDRWNRAIPSLETKSYILIGNYQKRPFAIEKCALAAAKRGWSVFALQHQGWCASGPTAGRTYIKYGRSNTCKNGKGGPWGNDVYVLEGKARQRTTSGDICVFPFIYKRKLYNGCTRVNHNRPWCAITPNYDVDKLWGNC